MIENQPIPADDTRRVNQAVIVVEISGIGLTNTKMLQGLSGDAADHDS
jgi:hypothetical protein